MNMQQAKKIFDPGMPNIQYTTVEITTVAGIARAERLVEKGWKIYRSTPFAVCLSREARS